MTSEFSRFQELCELVSKDKSRETLDKAIKEVKDMTFDDLDMDQILVVGNSDWLPDDIAVEKMKIWKKRQDEVMLLQRSFLVLTPKISKDKLISFAEAIKRPNVKLDLEIEDILKTLATAGGTRRAENPLELGLITCQSGEETDQPKLALFDFNKDPAEISFQCKPETGNDAAMIVGLPPFLKAAIVSYKLGVPVGKVGSKTGGIKRWILSGSNTLSTEDSDWETLDVRGEEDGGSKMSEPGVVEFKVQNQTNFYRYFRLRNRQLNYLGNHNLVLSRFDISGQLRIE